MGKHMGRQKISKSFLSYLVQGLETGKFKRLCQYSLLFGRLEADQCKDYNGWSPFLRCLLSVYLTDSHHM